MYRRKNIFCCIILLLCLQTNIMAQDSIRHYYYKGQKINLHVDSISLGILTKDTTQIKSLINSVRYSCDVFVPVSDNGGYSFFSIIHPNNCLGSFQLKDSLGLRLASVPFTTTTTCFKRKNKETKGLTNRFYVQLYNEGDTVLLKNFAMAHDVELLYAMTYMPDWFVLSCPYNSPQDALDMANLFFESGLFVSAEPEFVFKGKLASNDTYYPDQWGLHNTGQYSDTFPYVDINVTSAWKISKGGNSLVAIYDNGVYSNHPDLIQNVKNQGYDAQTGHSPALRYGKHGTTCAGIVAAVENEIGVVGVAPEADITSISIGLTQFNTPEQYANGFNWAMENNIDVISNSWGILDTSMLIETAISRATNEGRNGKGCVMVFAAGNNNDLESDTSIWYPGKFAPEILVVGAISPCGERKSTLSCDHEFWGSCFGEQLDIMAPGVLIPTTDIPGAEGYNPNEPIHVNNAGNLVSSDYDNTDYTVWFNGTSAACPHVAGVAALVLSANPNLHGQEVCNIIEETAKKVRPDLYEYSDTISRPNGTWNPYMGYGLLDAHRAVLKAAYHKVYGDTAISICDTSVRAYTVRAPHNANIDSVSFFWTCTDNLQMVAGISIGNEKLEIRNYGKC